MKSGSLNNRMGSRHGATAVPKTLASLDIGTTKICCVIAEALPAKHKSLADTQPALKILGFGQTASRGVKAGSIINVEEAERAIRLVVDAAERMAERHINACQCLWWQTSFTGDAGACPVCNRYHQPARCG
jgi:cell division ATPase FtsA